MNRFLTRRKDGDDHGKKSKKGKKAPPAPKVEVDLKIELPSTDDFRTSLIMPSLSTRFSMLREQDDPNTKLGKASDDSVLQPKRQSRLHEFGFIPGGLADIAEVSSLHGSIRPPFADQRQGSFDSQATDENGSMMSRARPGEGNVLFGGRQRVFKIAPGSNSGRALYEDDVHMSTFQKMRMEEKQKALQEFDFGEKTDENVQSDDTAYSPVSGYSQRRETSSSTNSGPANTRTSTAATSIASQGANSIAVSSPAFPSSSSSSVVPMSPTQEIGRSTTKGRRLYDQGLDRHIYDQQSSALNRLNSIQRTQVPNGRSTPPLFTQTRSATNLNDRFNRGGPRTDSPTAMGGHAAFNGKDTQSASSSPIVSRPQSPPLTSPLGSDSEDAQTLNSALQPNDRGKATAMGAFNKPKQAFSEQQYAERLRQMQQEREAPAPRVPEKSRKLTLRERAELEQRKRAEAGIPPQESSPEQKPAPSAFSVFQMAANQMKSPPTKTLPSPPAQQEINSQASSHDSPHGTTFFASPGSSDDEDDTPKRTLNRPTDLQRRLENIPTIPASNLPTAPINGHPAFRSRTTARPDDLDHPALRSRSNSRPPVSIMHNEPSPRTEKDDPLPSEDCPGVDSPTLGPDTGGLSGLIRQHLRNVSNVSSDYGDANQIATSPPPVHNTAPLSLRTRDVPSRKPQSDSDTPAPSTYSHSNPWDLDDLDNSYRGEGDSISSVSPVDAHKPRPLAQQSFGESKVDNEGSTPDWEKELKKSHNRGFSNETQNEQEAFQRELAQRKRAIEETLRNNASEEQSRSGSPAPTTPSGLKNALNMLRAKSSRESFATVEAHRQFDGQSKAMKMLGISENSSSTSLLASNDRPYGHEPRPSDEDRSGRLPQLRSKPSRMLEQSEQDARREFENKLQRSATDDSNHDARPTGRTPPASSRSSTRDRSSSEVSSGRSRSRPGQYRDDLDQAMTEGRSAYYPPNTAPSVPGYAANATQPLPTQRPSLDSQSGKLRSRSNSRVAGPAYLEPKHLQPIYTGNGTGNGTMPRLSPAAMSSGLPVSPRPSPGFPSPSLNAFRPLASPVPTFSAHNTPPVSGSSTPVLPSYNFPPSAPMNKVVMRKKSIAKTDISEPIFVSGTSVMDTVDLPAGASLKNGMDTPPPLPPINPMRRRFGFGRTETQDSSVSQPKLPFAEPLKTGSTEALPSQISQTRSRLRKTSSEGKSLYAKSQAQNGPSPAMPQGPFSPRPANGSPPRPINDRPTVQRPLDGAMF